MKFDKAEKSTKVKLPVQTRTNPERVGSTPKLMESLGKADPGSWKTWASKKNRVALGFTIIGKTNHANEPSNHDKVATLWREPAVCK